MIRSNTWLLIWVLISSIQAVAAQTVNSWNTLYSYNHGRIYIHLKNNDLLALNFSITGFNSDQAKAAITDLNLKNNQQIDTLPSPPENVSLFLLNDELYGLTNSQQSGELDVCGEGIIELIKYDAPTQSWNTLGANLDFSKLADASFYQYSTILTTPTDNSTIYIYGGVCQTNGVHVSNRLISLDFSTFKFANITTSTKPQAFYGAANLLAPNPQTQLVIGGQSNQGWLNMYQLATWDFASGWSFKQIGKGDNDATVNSRKFPLILPIFSQLQNNSVETVSNFLDVSEVLLIGGDLLGGQSTPQYAKLSTGSNDWSWNTTFNVSWDFNDILGAATIFNTLVIINSSSETTSKRDGSNSYSINLYDTSTFKQVESVKSNTVDSSTIGKDTSYKSIQKKAILGTVIPIVIIIIASIAGYLYMKRRKSQQEQEDLNDIDYQFGNYYDGESMLSGKPATRHNLLPTGPTSGRGGLMNLNNDTSSTLDVASIDSWVKKRQEFDQNRKINGNIGGIRNSYLASNETLSNHPSSTSEEEKELVDDEDVQDSPQLEVPSTPMQQVYSPLGNNLMNRSVSRLRKSLMFSTTPPTTPTAEYGPLVKKRSSGMLRKSSEQSFIGEGEPEEESKETAKSNMITEEDNDSDMSDDALDVQVLVSSKRRSVLKIMNPDDEETTKEGSIEEEEEPQDISENNTTNPFNDTVEIRQRVPSGGHSEDD
ncbi:uncharacterized protein RJT20DRAFT_122833 [Scheffersomyces xylosifermentans]|uniref:uncharacterized protein n=1 Tax=Scheffersomyces xylosifermentans TaxID=1304137 RepID=UPI00315DBCF7